MKKIIVPLGMFEEAMRRARETQSHGIVPIHDVLEAALRWLSENPIVPTKEQARKIWSEDVTWYTDYDQPVLQIIEAWQRRMFLAPEPEVPEAIKDLLWEGNPDCRQHLSNGYINKQIIEAYKRGKESK